MLVFLGAGASKSFGIPTLQEMTDEVKQIPSISKYDIESIQKKIGEFGFTPDLESVLTVLTSYIGPREAVRDSGPFPWYLSQYSRIDDLPKRPDLENAIQAIKNYIYETCRVKEEQIDKIIRTYDLLFDTLKIDRVKTSSSPERTINIKRAQLSGAGTSYLPVDIITTNYDLCVEQYCNRRKIPMTNGFDADPTKTKMIFNINNLSYREYPTDDRIRLHKLHGSIDQWITDKGDIILLQAKQDTTLYGDRIRAELLIYPIQTKYIYQDPFFELFHLFQEKLKRTPVCIVIGYSFRDEAVNNVFHNAVKKNPELKIFLIDPVATAIKTKLGGDLQRNIYQIDRCFDDPQLPTILKQPLENWIQGDPTDYH